MGDVMIVSDILAKVEGRVGYYELLLMHTCRSPRLEKRGSFGMRPADDGEHLPRSPAIKESHKIRRGWVLVPKVQHLI